MPGFLNAAVCGGLRRFRKKSNRRTANQLTDMAKRRFVRRSAAVLGNPQKIRLRRSAAVVRYSPPIPPYAPLARFRGAQGAVPGGATSRLARSSSMAKSAPSTGTPLPSRLALSFPRRQTRAIRPRVTALRGGSSL
jgi:hypothetical protein